MTEASPSVVADCMSWFSDTHEQLIEETLRVCHIPAPTFDEAERAVYVAERMRTIALSDVQVDDIHNVSGVLHCGDGGPTTLVVAHLDTVFPRATPLHVRRTKQRLYGPGIGDNSVAVAAMLNVAAAMQRFRPAACGRVIFAASVGEEGLGNLCGIRQLMETWRNDVDTVIALEGHGVDEIRHAGIGSTRLKVTFNGPGGHSWGAFGTPSAVHAMGTVIHKLSQFKTSRNPRTTFNVGMVEGGASVNTIAPRATMLVDLRSVSARHLAQLEARVTHLLEDVANGTGVGVESKVVGRRPAATLPVSHPLCKDIINIRKRLRMRPPIFSASSTDANLPLSLGFPALCLGITRGGLAHTVKEYIECGPILGGVKQLFLALLHTLEKPAATWRAGGQKEVR